jgi:nitrate reductase NapAB chaperone NapD
MSRVLIRRCPVCETIGTRTREVESALRRLGSLEVEVADGQKGELAVFVDGDEVLRKGTELPSVDEVVNAVKGTVVARQGV